MLGHRTGLVALQRADKMPLQRQIGQLRDLVDAFLDVVFTKGELAGGICLAYAIRRKSLADRQQLHLAGLPAGSQRRLPDALGHGLNCGFYCAHNENRYLLIEHA